MLKMKDGIFLKHSKNNLANFFENYVPENSAYMDKWKDTLYMIGKTNSAKGPD